MRVIVFFMLLIPAGCAGTFSRDNAVSGCEIASRYIDAADNSDPQRVASFLDDEIVVIFLSDTADHAERIEGRGAVLEAVRTYKETCPDCASKMTCHLENDSAVYVTEKVAFIDKTGRQRQQAAPLVLEMNDGKIARIIYFPAD